MTDAGRLSRTILAATAALVLAADRLALAQTSAVTTDATGASGSVPKPPSAIEVLLAQARHWRSVGQGEAALEALARARQLEPDNPDVLASLAETESAQGDRAAAQAALDQLRKVAPQDPRIATLAPLVQAGPIDKDALAEARRLAGSGQGAAAVAAYRRAFHNVLPQGDLAIEYYQVLAGTESGWEEAREGLARAVWNNPENLRGQLAYAEVLTYREPTRAEGIRRLLALTDQGPIAGEVRSALRQALGWLPETTDSIPLYESYLQRFPDDPDISERLNLARHPELAATSNNVGLTRMAAFAALRRGKLEDAARLFEVALEKNAQDSDALGGLGLVRLRQGRTAEARGLLQRAIAANPADKAKWQAALEGTEVGARWAEVQTLAAHGRTAEAEALLRRLAGSKPNTGALLLLADLQQRQGKLQDAAASYRQVLAAQPRSTAALMGLAAILARQGQTREAEALYADAEAAGSGAAASRARAELLREQAREVSDPSAQMGLYRAALASDPTNPWIRLELARLLVKQGRQADAAALWREVLDAPQPSAATIEAATYFAMEMNDSAQAAALIARLPPAARTPEMKALAARVAFEDEIRQIVATNTRDIARARLLALAAHPDPDGTRGAALIRALAGLGDRTSGREVVATALAATQQPTAAQRIAYAGALMETNQEAGAPELLAGVNSASLTPEQAQALAQLRAGLAVRLADTLSRQGRLADAYDRLAPVLAQDPANPDANMALARLYVANQQPEKALQIDEALLNRDPGNLSVRQAAVAAAIAAGDLRRARQWADEGTRLFPSDPRAFVIAADVARAEGNEGAALRALRMARDLRLQQIGASRPDSGSLLGSGTAPAGASPSTPAVVGPMQRSDAVPAGGVAPAVYLPNAPRATRLAEAGREGTAPAEGGPEAAAPAENEEANGGRQLAFASDTTDQLNETMSAGGNPFRQDSAGDQHATGPYTNFLGGGAGGSAGNDPMLREIDQQIALAQEAVAPKVQAGFDLRSRSGSSGLDQLTELMVPLEATFSPGGVGHLKLTIAPTHLSAGTLSNNVGSLGSFGTLALYAGSPATPSPGAVQASGVGFDLQYDWRWLTVDIGSTPVGFRILRPVGGIELAPQISDQLRLRVTAEDRPVTDSVLSYAGLLDPRTGTVWGGVTRARGHIQLEYNRDLANFYVGGGYGVLTGQNVERNTEWEFGAGVSYPVYRGTNDELRLGLDLVGFGYDKNLLFFTLGGGGYFSPQNYYAGLIPLTYSQKLDNLSWSVGASVGYQTYSESANTLFPLDQGLQAQLVNIHSQVPAIAAYAPAQSQSGIVGGIHGNGEYRISTGLSVGGSLSYQRAAYWNELTGLVYARIVFNGSQ